MALAAAAVLAMLAAAKVLREVARGAGVAGAALVSSNSSSKSNSGCPRDLAEVMLLPWHMCTLVSC